MTGAYTVLYVAPMATKSTAYERELEIDRLLGTVRREPTAAELEAAIAAAATYHAPYALSARDCAMLDRFDSHRADRAARGF